MGAATAAVVAWGLAVGAVGLLGCGVAVAEDPQANSRATNSRTIAFGRCLIMCDVDLEFSTATSLLIRVTVNKSESHMFAAFKGIRAYNFNHGLYVNEHKLSMHH